MFRDPYFAIGLLGIAVISFVETVDGFSLGSAAILLLALFGPFAILGLFLSRGALRTQAGWDRPGAPNEVVVNERDE